MIRRLPPAALATLAAATVALPLLAGAASAQDRDNARHEPNRPDWSFEMGAGTDNRSKGTSKSGNAPYAFGEAQWNTASGFYADVEFDTIDASGSHIETEMEAGWQFSGLGFGFDASSSYKRRLNADPGQDAASWEYQFDVIRDFGAADGRLRIEYTPDSLGSTQASTWVEARLRWPLADRLKASITVGRGEQDNAPDYTGWNAGVAFSLTGTTDLDLRWHGTDAASEGEQYEGALVASVLVSF